MTDLKKLPDEEFQELMKVVVDYDYDLALEIEHLTSVDQIPDEKWDDFVAIYNKIRGIKDTSKKKKRTKKRSIFNGVIGLSIALYSFSKIDNNQWANFYKWIGNEQAVISNYSKSAEFYVERGNTKYLAVNFSGAIADFSKAIEINPRYAKAYYNRGTIKGRYLEDYDGAISDYSKSIEINPRYADAYINRGIAKDELKDYYGAIADYNKAIEINPRYAKAYNNRAQTKYILGDMKGSCTDAKKAASLGSEESKRILSGSIGAEICGSSRN